METVCLLSRKICMDEKISKEEFKQKKLN